MFGINQLVDFHFRDRRVRKEYEELKERRERRYIIIITPNGTQLEEKMIRVSSLDSKRYSAMLGCFHLNGQILVFHPQTKKLEPPCASE